MKLYELKQKYPSQSDYFSYFPQYIQDHIMVLTYEPEEIIFMKGQCAEYVYVLFLGSVRIINNFESGKYYFINVINSTQRFNEFPDMMGSPAIVANAKSYTTMAISDSNCIILRLSKYDFLKWFNSDPVVAKSVAIASSHHLMTASHLSESRLSHTTLYLFVEYFTAYAKVHPCPTGRIRIDYDRQEMADRFCVTVRTVNRILSKLACEGYIQIHSHSIDFTSEQEQRLNKLIMDLH